MSLNYVLNEWFDELEDPTLGRHVPGGPWRVVGMSSLYLLFVLKVGPHYMKHRAAYSLKTTIQLFNVVNVIFNAALFAACLINTNFAVDCFDCPRQSKYTYFVCFGYYYLKVRMQRQRALTIDSRD